MTVPDPYLIEVYILPAPAAEGWLEASIATPPVRMKNRAEAESLCREIIATSERRLRGTRPKPSIQNMVEPDGRITFIRAVAEGLRSREGALGRSKRIVDRDLLSYGALAYFHVGRKSLPAFAIDALKHALGLSAAVERRWTAERMVQWMAQSVALYNTVPTNEQLSRRLKVTTRYLQKLREHRSVRERLEQMTAFFAAPAFRERLINLSGDSDPRLIDALRDAVPDEWQTYGDETALRCVAAFLSGSAHQKSTARLVAYRMIQRNANAGIVTPSVLVNAVGLALGIGPSARA